MHTKNIERNSASLYLRTIGEGPEVVLLHGFGETGDIWQNQWPALPGFRLLIPDLPGSGRSAATPDLSMDGMAATIWQMLAAEGVQRCTIIGHSMGGYIALAMLEQQPQNIAGLGLFHSSAFADTEAKKETRTKGIAFMQQHGAPLFLQTATPNLYAPASLETKKELITQHIDSVNAADTPAHVAYYRAMMDRPDRTHLLRQTDLPWLFVLGKYDQAVPLDDGLKQAHLPRQSFVHLLQNSGHMGMVEEREICNKLLLQYLQTGTVT
ncbi:Pimeloyl-ACP methyl ester carboxylesterase [Cnuella takakiae]|uniref:Pimeloyl-ACP methyl ester carboxylesterase n=1 Tax=Cnuella takakiae TaxID=1302690 RepID=A0A1M5C2M5_9BACT|nr:alpha/beta hydrolase [Cnuella takakiae]OLY93599.1 hypothetical protein BUE76_18260 [Cnuella takakiae]SHF48915.1 Pimeloyl-ACP methyl ester carboxylesterase [Cnuella takakiae]